MASSPKLISILSVLFAVFSVQIHAREFFSKIPSVNNNEKETTAIPQTRVQEPRFIPETQNGYGLYGHESGQLPPSTTTTTTKETYEPYVTPVKYHPDEPYNSIPASNHNNKNTFYYNKDAYESTSGQQNLGKAEFTEKGWSIKENQNSNGEKQGISDTRYLENGRYYYDVKNENNNYPNQFETSREVASRNGEKQGMSNTRYEVNGRYFYDVNNEKNYYPKQFENSRGVASRHGEKQGMSDTRYLQNGRYFYDVNSEKNYYPNQFENSRGVASRNEFNENRYNNDGRYNQNQEEFEEREDEFEP
ncbi:hypothetical protein DITRI_Ditri02bG0036000 [Diplodiscus trichospermus]